MASQRRPRVAGSRLQQASRRGNGRHLQPSRLGISVFVDFISKMIHRATLKEAFSGYGKVIDTYIAYNNPGRLNRSYTFAFVRFSNREEALREVEFGNNRRMDGFTIKVFLANNELKKTRPGIVTANAKAYSPKPNKKELFKLTNGRSFKEVLLTKSEPGRPCSFNGDPEEMRGENFKSDKPIADPYHFSLSGKELAWMDNCLVGQIKGMYDASFVEQVLLSEGFKVKVSIWSGFYVIIYFFEQEQIEIFWDLKKSLLKTWFDDIDTLEHFSSHKKQKIWVVLENVPLVAWNNSVFSTIVSRWGSVIKIEDDTSQKNRFDSARILTGVRCLSAIPAGVSIFINGVSYFIKISTSSYEDERSWIDADQPKSHLEEQKADESDEEASCRFEDFNTRIYVETAGYSPKTEENANGRHVRADGHQRAINGEKVAVPSTKGQSNVSPHESDKLVEVPIVSASDSAKASSGSTGSISPVLDEKTGLFIIRPKSIKVQSSWVPSVFRHELERLHTRNSPIYATSKFSTAKKKIKTPKPLLSDETFYEGRSSKKDSIKGTNQLVEAQAALDVCKAVGLHFAVSDEIVCSRLAQIESEKATQD
ncbi:hypothetical protein GQ457_02G016420 [Hibiscus cannabinus]